MQKNKQEDLKKQQDKNKTKSSEAGTLMVAEAQTILALP